MKKTLCKIVSLIVLILISFNLVACKDDRVAITVYNWGDYIDESVISEFEKEYDIKVIYEQFATNEEMYVKLKNSPGAYDVAIPSEYMIVKMINEDLLEEIDMNNVPNFEYIDDKFKDLDFDPHNKYSIPYMWGTVGVVYNKSLIDDEIVNWSDLWDSKYEDQILMLNSQRDSIGVALKKLGYSLNEKDSAKLQEAKEQLVIQKPLVRAYVGDEVKDMIIEEEAAIAVVWSGDAIIMMGNNEDLDYVVPMEGSNVWFDNMVIPKGTKHKREAELFINFMNRPDIAKRNVDYIGYSTPNKKAFELLDEDIQNNKAAYPEESVLDRCEIFLDLGERVKEYDKIWTDIMGE